MYVFYLIAMLMANGFQQKQAVIFLEHQTHITHVKHVEHVDYQIYLTKLAQAKAKPIVAQVPPVQLPKTSPVQPAPEPTIPAPIQTTTAPGPLSHYSCSSLESLWISEGGNPANAFMAAEIATAESGGNPNAISPTNDYGLWQINGSWGPLATLDPYANARSAIQISNDGTNWGPWTTFTSGAYIGQCG